MAKRVAVMLGEGFEPVEACAPVDILRRGNVEVTTVSVMGVREVVSAHGIPIVADALVEDVDLGAFDMVLLPGGMPGVTNLGTCEKLTEAVKAAFADENRWVAAICAAPMILADLGLLKGRKATCYPGCEGNFPQGAYQGDLKVCRDGNLITASGPGQALAFGFEVLRALCGEQTASSVYADMQM